jgi:hypothetical protein
MSLDADLAGVSSPGGWQMQPRAAALLARHQTPAASCSPGPTQVNDAAGEGRAAEFHGAAGEHRAAEVHGAAGERRAVEVHGAAGDADIGEVATVEQGAGEVEVV